LLRQGFAAQWNDDSHHVLHVLLTGETDGYYADYANAPAEALARCLQQGFIYQGQPSAHRQGEARGQPSADLSPTSFVLFLQNHDQTGNRAFGERLTTLAPPDALRAAQALMLLSPQIPLLFMGEESGSTTPFFYFTSHRTEALAEAVRQGRAREFSASSAFADSTRRSQIPDPNAEGTFTRSIPGSLGEHGEESTATTRQLLSVRRERITPQLPHCRAMGARAIGPGAVLARWKLGSSVLAMMVNLAAEPVVVAGDARLQQPSAAAELLWDTGGVRTALASGGLPGHALIAWLESA
jgi:maltooligosyltrehalose trehalohydrolase